jgi:predicted Rossmann-fold nucleotide-binding protein
MPCIAVTAPRSPGRRSWRMVVCTGAVVVMGAVSRRVTDKSKTGFS